METDISKNKETAILELQEDINKLENDIAIHCVSIRDKTKNFFETRGKMFHELVILKKTLIDLKNSNPNKQTF